MLYQLTIQNFALIDNLVIDFHEKLNVLTGETGAGKSIIIDAVSLLLGARGQSEFIRNPENKALVEGVFILEEQDSIIMEYLQSLGMDENEKTVILTREISKNGKNVCRINNRAVTLAIFKELGSLLINIYGQHDYQALSQADKHIEILDSLGDKEYQDQLEKVKEVYQNWSTEKNKLNSFQALIKEKALRLDFLKFQLSEIEEINPMPNEDEELKKELAILNNVERIAQNTSDAYELLYGNKSIYDNLSEVIHKLSEIHQFDDLLANINNDLENIMYQIEDCARSLNNYHSNLEFDHSLQATLQEREFLLNKIKRKYGCNTINEILNIKETIINEINDLEKSEVLLTETQNKVKELEEEYNKVAKEMSLKRQELSQVFTKKIIQQLQDLAMIHTTFKVEFSPIEGSIKGIDKIEFLISPNPGQPLKPLAKIASGGEMSRIMLAFKVILTDFDSLKTLIFDEIDTGIGGNIVTQVAEKLFQVSKSTQVICVTHSPIIASVAHNHILIRKNIEENTTYTDVKTLSEKERVLELARMLGDNDPITIDHANELRKKWNKSI
ncbi:MAG: DNA repair protein RecN [Clostridia bacterium]|nr:DNA repair protein RecN [Clostridia bacterium]